MATTRADPSWRLDAGGPLDGVQVDAHIDWRNQRFGERLGFWSTMRRASELAHVERIVQVGMRNYGTARAAEVRDAAAWGAHIVTAREVRHGAWRRPRAHPRGRTRGGDDRPGRVRRIADARCHVADAGRPRLHAGHGPARRRRRARDAAAFDLIEFVPDRDVTGSGAATAVSLLLFAVGVLANA